MNTKTATQYTLLAIFLALLMILATPHAFAKTWRNAYVSFELPEKWNCTLEQTEWVCRSTEPGLAEAIIILTAKEVGPQDSLANYEAHLKQQRTIMTRAGQPIQSTVYQTETRTISNHPWINSLHFSSEVFNYYTRYVATTKDKIAILITLSAHKLHYTKYSADFFKAIDSLRVVATRGMFQGQGGDSPGIIGQSTDAGMPGEPGFGDEGGGSRGDNSKVFFGVALLIGAAGFYLMLKRRKKR